VQEIIRVSPKGFHITAEDLRIDPIMSELKEGGQRRALLSISIPIYFISFVLLFFSIGLFQSGSLFDLALTVFLLIFGIFFFGLASSSIIDALRRTSIIFEDNGIWSIKALGKRTTKRFIGYEQMGYAVLSSQVLSIRYRLKGKKRWKFVHLMDEEVTDSVLKELSAKGIEIQPD
jgi:hypothetical protein